MKVSVDESQCIGCRLCKDVCDPVFTFKDGVSRVVEENVDEGLRECILDAEAVCPTEAITVEED
ncbi:MAG: ferredoxin [Coriobacteriia bacterium]